LRNAVTGKIDKCGSTIWERRSFEELILARIMGLADMLKKCEGGGITDVNNRYCIR